MTGYFDTHIHTNGPARPGDVEALLARLDEAGIAGGSLFSQLPGQKPFAGLPPVMARVEAILGWTQGHADRLFPVLSIHPQEEGALEAVRQGAARGIAGFKMLCTDYLVSDRQSMDLLAAIAETGRPVTFHSGILWDGRVSSEGSRPLHFEALLDIPRLRFALAHCSWPWIDECLSLYGKFLNSYVRDPEVSSEMFFDLTPGTPEIYRRELIEKLFTIGYDVPHNLLFGTDCSAPGYNVAWCRKWLGIDGKILDALGVPAVLRSWLYHDNYLRFLGRSRKDFTHISPVPDGLERWSLEDFAQA